MYCSKCGKELIDGSLFCNYCGTEQLINTMKKVERESVEEGSISTEKWFYVNCIDDESGPYTDAEIVDLIYKHVIKNGTRIRKENYHWIPAEESVFSKYITEDITEKDTEKDSNSILSEKWIWALASVPLLLSMFFSVIGITGIMPAIIVIIANILFVALDVAYLKQTGKNIEEWIWLGVIIVPLYLIVRENKTNKNAIPTILWFVLFFINLFL